MSTPDERKVNPIEVMTHVAQTVIGVASWGFKESYQSAKPGELIYDSEWCRTSFIWGGWDYGGGNSIHIRYGRLHALSEKTTMFWNGEECHCWHDFNHALHFLDGHRAVDVVNQYFAHPVTDPFYEEEFRQRYRRRQPEWLAQMHLTIWQHYGNRFFELFDLRRSDQWQQYRQFLKEFYDIKGRRPGTQPPSDKVC